MSRLTDLLRQVANTDPQLAKDLKRETDALADRRAFGLNFERHTPEAVELPGRPVRKNDKVRLLLTRAEQIERERLKAIKEKDRSDEQKATLDALNAKARERSRLWRVTGFERHDQSKLAHLVATDDATEARIVAVEDLVVVAEFRDPIYPGLVSTGKVERGGNKPFHTVINAENYHALQAMLFIHRGAVDCIYIDPPYNTGAKVWKYNNDYVEADDHYLHSKWLAFMERRLLMARELLAPTGSIIVTIDEHEVNRLGVLLQQVFDRHIQQMVTIVNNPKGVTQGYLSRVEEYAFFCFGPDSELAGVPDDLLTHREADVSNEPVRPRWKGLLRSGDESLRADRPNMYYPVWLDPRTRRLHSAGEPLPEGTNPTYEEQRGSLVAAWPVRSDGAQGRWGVGPDTLNELIAQGLAACGGFDKRRRTWGITYASAQVRSDLESGKIRVLGTNSVTGVADIAYVNAAQRRARTVWHRSSHDAGAHGTDLVGAMLGSGRAFPFPKSLYAVEDCVRLVTGNKLDAVVLDFFAGSGTTAHAVARLNKQDGGRRRCISVTNNEVSADEQDELRKKGLRPGDPDWERWGICDYITKPRVEAAITGRTPAGDPIKGDYKFTDEFPMADGFAENVEFFTLTYESAMRVSSNREFRKIAPFLWLRAGSRGRRIEDVTAGWDVADAYGVIANLDRSDAFVEAVEAQDGLTHAFIVTDEDRLFEALVRRLPAHVEPVRLYSSYLRNFEIEAGRTAR